MRVSRTIAVLLGLSLLASLIFVTTRSVSCSPTAKTRSAPVVIFVVIDTLRADRMSLCGYRHPTTPYIEDLVDDGASYACDSHSPSTWTLPSHASFFTGVEPDEHEAGNRAGSDPTKLRGAVPLGPELPTLAEEMSARGYQTLLLSGNPVVSEVAGLTRGFDHVAIGRTFPMMHDHRLAERLKGLLRVAKLDPGQPLFAFINIADPHDPWTAVPEGTGFLPARSALTPSPNRRRFQSGAMPEEEAAPWLSHLSDVYDYAVLRADGSLELVLEVLRSAGWLGQGYRLVITSDHGELLGEHRLIGHAKELFYEPLTRVPFIYFSTEGKLELPGEVPSISAHALLRDGILPAPLPQSFASVFRRSTAPPADPSLPCSYSRAALWEGGAKLVADEGRVVRFDLTADPDEEEPRPADDHPAAPSLLAHCRALDEAYTSHRAVDPDLEAEVAAQLKALGYLHDDDEPAPAEPVK